MDIMIDEFDRKILKCLQEQADISMAELGKKVGLSHTPCWRRVKALEDAGVIARRVALLDPKSVDLGLTVFLEITMKSHDEELLLEFEAGIQAIDNVVECYESTGDSDYVLRIIVENVERYETLLRQKIVRLPNVGSVKSTFALKKIKYTTALPL